jgi:dipeptidyl aminopeptidase/acylaminoacyl peptidase
MYRCVIILLAVIVGASGGSARQSQAGLLTIDLLLDIKHPSEARWSPSGDAVAYLWDRGGVQNVWVAPIDGGSPGAVTRFTEGLIDSLDWAADGQSLFFIRQGVLMRVPRQGGTAQPVWSGSPIGDAALSPDRTQVAFVRSGDLFVRGLNDEGERQLTRDIRDVSGPVWSPDGKRIAFIVAATKRVNEDAPYAGDKVVFTRVDREPGRLAVVTASDGAVRQFGESPGGDESPRWLDANRVVFQRMSADVRTREVVIADAQTGAETVLHRDVDPKFWSLTYLNAEPVPSPDGRWVAFISDEDGWDHLYVSSVTDGRLMQLTRGRFEVSRFQWASDSKRIVFDRNDEDAPGTRHIVVATFTSSPDDATIETLTDGTGTNTDARWSPDSAHLVYAHTDARNSSDLFVVAASGEATPRRLTDSMPQAIDRERLVEPRFVRYPGPGGASVPAYLFVPSGLDRSKRAPAIIWVHGDGINQNYDGWHIHRDYGVYYSFHQYLVQQGYVVLSVDYRGSIGYGRDWRQGHYRDLGGSDYQDIAGGVDYLKTLGYVDAERVGIWGLSYGGFMALQALTVTPELFRCAIDVAGVEDWNDWYRDPGGPWILGRMGTPDENQHLYRRLSPIYHLERVVRPLLVLHGTSDVNVPFLESVRLVDEMTKLNKRIEFVMYPGEFHYFHRAHVLRDAWTTVEQYFARHLKP